MEFNEKLQLLRKQKGLTQEELANLLFVSRTAVSKWESGRGYPNIESLKAIAKFFSVSLDELLSNEEMLNIAEEDGKQRDSDFRDLLFGLLDICFAMLLFLPFFADKGEKIINGVSLLALDSVSLYLRAIYFVFVIGTVAIGVLTLALQKFQFAFWLKIKTALSGILSVISLLLFVISLQPYAAVFAFVLLAIKAMFLIKRR